MLRLSSGWLAVVDKVPVGIASLIVLVLTVIGQRHVGAIPGLAKINFAMRLG
jgi:hypothetical protein